jgi:hypothetical protein
VQIIGRVHGDYCTYEVHEDWTVWGTKYYVTRDGKAAAGSFTTRSEAFRWAREKAGPNADETMN